jgi:hypothetical protein
VQDELGTEPLLDWNRVWDDVQQVFKTLPDDVEGWAKGAKGTAQKKIFRDCFTTVDPEAAPVIAKHHKIEPLDRAALFPGQTLPADLGKDELYALLGLYADGRGKHIEYEPDPALKDAENIPLKEDIVSYVLREVRPYVADAWIDREHWTSRTAASARWATRSTSTACSSSTSRRARCTRSMPNWPAWSSGFWTCCGRRRSERHRPSGLASRGVATRAA